MDNTPEAIIAFAAEQAVKEWQSSQRPYLLARLSPDLAGQGMSYREILGEQKLKDFIRTAPNQVKVVIHPIQKSKIGLIPPDKDYTFSDGQVISDAAITLTSRNEPASASRRRYIVSNFLQLISELSDEDAAQIQIPTHLLTKLLRDQ